MGDYIGGFWGLCLVISFIGIITCVYIDDTKHVYQCVTMDNEIIETYRINTYKQGSMTAKTKDGTVYTIKSYKKVKKGE